MKSKDVQEIVLSKLQNGQFATQISLDLNGMVSTRTIERWSKQYSETGSIELSHSTGRRRSARTKAAIKKVKQWGKGKSRKSVRIFARKLNVSRESVRRIMKHDLQCKPYKVYKQPKLTEDHKRRRVQFANWIRNNFKKSQAKRIVFSDEKLFSVDGVWNRQNERIWAVSREEANEKGGLRGVSKFPGKIMVWLGACANGVSKVVFLEDGTVNHEKYISEVLPVAKRFGNTHFGNDWWFQQDGARAHTVAASQNRCKENLPNHIEKDRWPANSPDLNPLDYSVWNEIVQGMNWDAVGCKESLKRQILLSVRKIRHEVVLDSCSSFYTRIRRLAVSDGGYMRK